MKEAKAYCEWHFVALNEWGVCPECRKQELKELFGEVDDDATEEEPDTNTDVAHK